MKRPHIVCAFGMLLLTRHNNFPGFATQLLVIIIVISGIMSVIQLIRWIGRKVDPPMTVEQRNRHAGEYVAKKSSAAGLTKVVQNSPPPLPNSDNRGG